MTNRIITSEKREGEPSQGSGFITSDLGLFCRRELTTREQEVIHHIQRHKPAMKKLKYNRFKRSGSSCAVCKWNEGVSQRETE